MNLGGAANWKADQEIPDLMAGINANDGSVSKYFGKYTAERNFTNANPNLDARLTLSTDV